MRYECPRIIRRDAIAGLLVAAKSDIKQPDGVDSDVNIKENIVPVRW